MIGARPPVRLRAHGDARVVEVRGELDVATAPALREALAAVVDDGDGPVVVDLGSATLLSSAALATLLNASRRLARRRRPLLVAGGPAVARVLRLARLEETFRLAPDVETALERCRQGSAP